MFEKEAEEWADKGFDEKYKTLGWYARKNNFQKGAEFGYNKANEWHNPKEILPKKDCEVLIEYGEHKTHRVVDWNNKSQHFGSFSIDEVKRWKEIE